jgi:hypothetical protein
LEHEHPDIYRHHPAVDPPLALPLRTYVRVVGAALLASHPDGFVGRASLAWLARLSQSAIRQADGEISTEPR